MVQISGAAPVGRQTPAGGYAVSVLDADRYTIGLAAAAELTATLPNNAFAVTAGSAVNLLADRPGCSSIARAFMSRDGAPLTADQVLAGVAECETRDRLGALQFDPNALGR